MQNIVEVNMKNLEVDVKNWEGWIAQPETYNENYVCNEAEEVCDQVFDLGWTLSMSLGDNRRVHIVVRESGGTVLGSCSAVPQPGDVRTYIFDTLIAACEEALFTGNGIYLYP